MAALVLQTAEIRTKVKDEGPDVSDADSDEGGHVKEENGVRC